MLKYRCISGSHDEVRSLVKTKPEEFLSKVSALRSRLVHKCGVNMESYVKKRKGDKPCM
jgi:hypothetical protein